MKKKKVFIGLTLGFLAIATPLAIGLSLGLNNNIHTQNNQYIQNKLNDKNYNSTAEYAFAPESDYKNTDEAIKYDAIEKSKSNSIIFYYIGWIAVFHRFSFLVHLTTLLEHNPNKQIHIYSSKNTFDLSFLLLDKYPNIYLNEIINETINIENLKKSLVIDKNFIDDIDLYSQNNKIDMYVDDKSILTSIESIFSIDHLEKQNFQTIINQFGSMLYKPKSINLFSDGIASTWFYSSKFYHWLARSNNIYNTQTLSYLVNERYFLNFKENNFPELNNFVELFYFMISPLISTIQSNDHNRSKFFHTSVQAIIDTNYNNEQNRILIKKSQQDFFDPYNSVNAGIIKTIMGFNEEQKKQLLIGLKVEGTLHQDNLEFDFMNDALNIVYSGRLLVGLSYQELINECNKIIQFYNVNKEKYPDKKIQIIFKGHPREHDEAIMLSTLKFEISTILVQSPEDIDWLFTLNRKIPFELYLAFNIFFDYLLKSREILIYVGYSTIALMTYNYNESINIESFLLSIKENNDINWLYGKNSKLFFENKRIII